MNGVIAIYGGQLYLCTNDDKFDGLSCPNRHGHKYSWLHDYSINNIKIDGHILLKVDGYVTPYRKFPVEIGKTYHSKLIKQKYKRSTELILNGLHSYGNYQNAANYSSSDIIVKCIIPKGSVYYEGSFDDKKSYASNCIIYVEIVSK